MMNDAWCMAVENVVQPPAQSAQLCPKIVSVAVVCGEAPGPASAGPVNISSWAGSHQTPVR